MLYIIGVGPGDPELLTLKAVRAIRASDAVAAPDGGVALRIAWEHLAGKQLLSVRTPMSEDAETLRAAHDAALSVLAERLERGETVSYLVLGDPSLYASCAYLIERFSGRHPVEVIPGVPAMCAAAAALRVPLASGREELLILPGYREGDPLPEGNLAVMKAGRCLGELRAACAGREAYCAQNVGQPGEKLGALADAEGAGYFTTAIVRARA